MLRAGFYNTPNPADVALDSNPANTSYCSLAVQADVLPQRGTVFATWQVCLHLLVNASQACHRVLPTLWD
jgi:hypothetical protein